MLLRYVGRRILQLVPVLFLVSVVIFSILHALPGDPVQLMLAGAESGSVPPERQDELLRVYRDGLLQDTLPFWLPRSVDREHGGFLLCQDRDGTVIDTDKGMWQQCRFTWLDQFMRNGIGIDNGYAMLLEACCCSGFTTGDTTCQADDEHVKIVTLKSGPQISIIQRPE